MSTPGERLSELPAAGAETGTESIPEVQAGVTSLTTPAAIETYVAAHLPNVAITSLTGDVTASGVGIVAATVANVPAAALPAYTGDVTKAAGSTVTVVAKIGGATIAPSATSDTTNAANITTGTLAASRLPLGITATPAAGQILIGNAGGTAYGNLGISGDAALASTGALTVTKTSGVAFAASATTDATNAANITSGTLALLRGGTGQATRSAYSGIIDARDYAIDPTGVVASDVALNLAIQDAITQKKKLVLPGGIFLLNAPLLCFTVGTSFSKIDIEGQGGGVPSANSAFPGIPLGKGVANTILCMNSKVLPAMIYQGNRSSMLKNVAIIGQNTQAFFNPTPATDVRSDYITAGCTLTYQSPYAGIAIDPFGTTTPADGGYAGLTSYYSATYPGGVGSSEIVFENVWIVQFVVAIAHSTGGVLQGDMMTFRNLNIQFCDTAYGGGNTQSRTAIFTTGNINWCRQAFDTINYGTGGAGCNPQVIENLLFVELYRIFALNKSTPCLIKGCYAESIKTLGQFGTGSGGVSAPVTFIGNQWNIREGAPWTPAPPLFFESYAPTSFRGEAIGCDLGTRDAWNIICSGMSGVFDACYFTGSAYTDLPPYIGINLNGDSGIKLNDCFVNSTPGQFTITDVYRRTYGVAAHARNGRLRATWQTRSVPDNLNILTYQPPVFVPYIACAATAQAIGTTAYTISGISKAASAVVTVNTVSTVNPFSLSQPITFASVGGMVEINGLIGIVSALGGASGAWTAAVNINSTGFTTYTSGGTATVSTLAFTATTPAEILANDILMWLMVPQGYSVNKYNVPAWKVVSVNTGTGACIANPLWDIGQYDIVGNQNSGSNNINIVLHQWAPTQALTGATATDTTLTSVSPTAILNGDWVTGAGIPAKTRVVSGGGTASLVLSKATTATASGVTLYSGRLLLATTTAAY